jgi:DNA repair protein RadD
MPKQLRPYQEEALLAVDKYLSTQTGNPCVCLPCASGKSVVMAACVRRWMQRSPWLRIIILAHRQELVEQNYRQLVAEGVGAPIGLYAAGLGRRDTETPILYATIDSIYKKGGSMAPWDAVFIDESHRIPVKGEGKYRTFLQECRRWSPKLRVVGWTATPYRMDCGAICHRHYILNDICYSAPLLKLMDDGYLCRLRSKQGTTQPDLSGVKLALVRAAVQETVAFMRAENRQRAIVFCVDVQHCHMTYQAFLQEGVRAGLITAKTSKHMRRMALDRFRSGQLQVLCNVQVLTEGFDDPRIDTIVLLRPTFSSGLYSQMVGRGLRIHPEKGDALILDFARCIETHGPIDLLDGPITVTATCLQCREVFPRALRQCPLCGWEIPKQTMESLEQTERERRMHDTTATTLSVLSSDPEIHKVDEVFVNRHRKNGNPDSIRVTFRCGLLMFEWWLTLDHPGAAGDWAQRWYRKYIGNGERTPAAVDDVLSNLLLPQIIQEAITTIAVRRAKPYSQVVGFNPPG